MPMTLSGDGTITGLAAGGLPDASIVTADIANASVTAAKLDGAQSGSAPIYGARAWVNFNGTGTVAIRASGNVSSITDVGVGSYLINFSVAMPDANYAATAINDLSSNGAWYVNPYIAAYQTTYVQYVNYSSYDTNLNPTDCTFISVTVFR
jgi:hypothetical protein